MVMCFCFCLNNNDKKEKQGEPNTTCAAKQDQKNCARLSRYIKFISTHHKYNHFKHGVQPFQHACDAGGEIFQVP